MTRLAPYLIALMVASVAPLGAQVDSGGSVPRGSLVFRVEPAFETVRGFYPVESGGRIGLGSGFFVPALDGSDAPALAVLDERLRGLAGAPGTIPVRLGGTTGRLSLEEHVVPLEVGYGVLDRVAVAITVPFVRRQVDAILRYSPTGANVGANPRLSSGTAVTQFLAGASAAVTSARASVDAYCATSGEVDPQCAEGRAALADAEAFLGAAGDAYQSAEAFPLAGGDLATAVQVRWTDVSTRLTAWNATPPSAVPFSTTPLSHVAFAGLVVAPAFPAAGIPLDSSPPIWDLGDVEAHVAVRLLDPSAPPSDGVAFRADVVLTGRLATGAADTLRALVPGTATRGVGGLRARMNGEALIDGRISVVSSIEAGWHGSRETVLLAPDPSRPFDPAAARTPARWTPGGHVRIAIVPRLRLGEAVFLAAGWEIFRQGADEFTALGAGAPTLPSPTGSRTVQSVLGELRYVARGATVGRFFPFEAYLRASGTVSGSGDRAPVERRIQAGVTIVPGG